MLDYELVDFGRGRKLERFGSVILERPEALAQQEASSLNWRPHSLCRDLVGNRYDWQPRLEPWLIRYESLEFELRQSQSKNIGIFPEQEQNWKWLSKRVRSGFKVLNLFAYTGVASLVCAKAGACVTHVDASKSTVAWASANAQRNQMKGIRWIVDDAQKFAEREFKRGNRYDGIILDPPPFGLAQNKQFVFQKEILNLLVSCKVLLRSNESFFLLNSYAQNMSPQNLKLLIGKVFYEKKAEVGELKLGPLSISTYARF
ncbi:MAG: class I SAM-dependent methyltransferase [Myxococcaceae bacterium]|nr:class I SAM-dependent methyltransferase [Myxococcaceae bacterium]MBH2006236.1 class I SAM-dependent methyltransferase [Myxococcaceae bacterium]